MGVVSLELQTPATPDVLRIHNSVDEIIRMSEWLGSTLTELGIPAKLQFNFDLCANEAVTNIISYAYTDHLQHEILISLKVTEDAVNLTIEDDGVPFNPTTKPEHVQPSSLEEAEIGGLGIDLIRKLMDQCRYERRKNRNVLTLISHISKPET
jgi:serine/threonine-protein kinase RsbW